MAREERTLLFISRPVGRMASFRLTATNVYCQHGWQTINKKSNAHQTRNNISLISCAGISSDFGENSLFNCASPLEIAKKTLNSLFLDLKVVQGHPYRYYRKARQQCLLWWAASMCLSVTVLALYEFISVKYWFLRGYPIWCSRSRESIHPSAWNLVAKKLELDAIIRCKPGVYISPGLESVPGRDRLTDGRTCKQNYDS